MYAARKATLNGNRITIGTHNVADFEKKLGRPLNFDVDKMVPLSHVAEPAGKKRLKLAFNKYSYTENYHPFSYTFIANLYVGILTCPFMKTLTLRF